MAEAVLYVGLDYNDLQPNVDFADELANSDVEGNWGFKINLDGAFFGGPQYVTVVVEHGRPVFVDLKMNNGARTMGNLVRGLGDLGVTHTNVWAQSDTNLAKMMDEVATVGNRPAVLANVYYTRWDDDYALRNYGMSVDDMIYRWSKTALEAGADGLILPGNKLSVVEDFDTFKLSPAVRIGGASGEQTDSQQEQVTDPREGARDGLNGFVVGSPIKKGRAEALAKYLSEIRHGEAERANRDQLRLL